MPDDTRDTAATPPPETGSSGSALHTALKDYGVIALVLQGGGALGSYQGGVVQGLLEAGVEPNWVAGISIGALNAAIIAGNPRERRLERLRAFWDAICAPQLLPASWAVQWPEAIVSRIDGWPRSLANAWDATRALLEGQPGFFRPRLPPYEVLFANGPAAASFYDTAPLRATLLEFADFERINHGPMRVSVGAVNVGTGNFTYFDNRQMRLAPEHFMASGALPPGFPAVAIDGEYYWDGGLVSNTPLSVILDEHPRPDALVFQVDLWSAGGTPPANVAEVATRQKDIQYSSRTRMITELQRRDQQLRKLLLDLVKLVPDDQHDHPARREAVRLACARRVNVQHLIYRDKPCESHYKDYQFGPATMREHWASGLDDIRRALTDPQRFDKPSAERPFVTWDGDRMVV